jgi:two-component system cell cycle sensor histidine kinase PleC
MICVGTIVQVLDHRRQAIFEVVTQLEAGADVCSIGSIGPHRGRTRSRPSGRVEGAIPAWMRAPGRRILVTDAEGVIVAGVSHVLVNDGGRLVITPVPLDAQTIGHRLLDVLGRAQKLTTAAASAGVTELTLPDAMAAFATVRHFSVANGQLAVVDRRERAHRHIRHGDDRHALATTGFVVLILGFAFIGRRSRARGRSDLRHGAYPSTPRSTAAAADCGMGPRAAISSGRIPCSPFSACPRRTIS